ncbi:MAG: alanine racemase [Minwuia sp.]|nr:alanine racemase [Minwuia sp.]
MSDAPTAPDATPVAAPASAFAAARLLIDLDALAANWRTIDSLAPQAETAGVVKADAYGIGLEPAVRALHAAGCRTFFCATIDEGIRLRLTLPDVRILVLNGLLPGSETAFTAHGLIPVLNDLADIARWRDWARARDRLLPCAVQLDTGMTRLGLKGPDTERLAAEPERLHGLDLQLWITHPACADVPTHPLNRTQLDRFRDRLAILPSAPASFCNSPAVHLGPEWHFDLIRPGVALYGANPTPATSIRMQEVVHLKAKILQIHRVDTPRTVGYGATHPVDGPARIATVGVGYGDGYPRSLSGRAEGRIGDHVVPLVGRVSMDLTTFDVSAVPEVLAQPGAEISLIGGGVDIDQLAHAGGTIAYELLTGLGRRYSRVYAGGVSDPAGTA